MMRLLFFIVSIWFVTSSINIPPSIRPIFGVKIGVQPNGDLLLFYIGISNGRSVSQSRYLNRREFFDLLTGGTKSPFNMTRKNIFLENEIDCKFIYDEDSLSRYPICFPIDSLWKIRYKVFPLNSKGEEGWSGMTQTPSPRQAEFLYKEYGIYNIESSFFMDSSFWKILSNVTDDKWIKSYKSLQ